MIDYYAYSDKETFVRTETSSHGCRIAVIIKEIPEWKTYNGESAFAQMILQQIYDGALESAWQADVDREVCTWKIRAKKKAPHRRMSEEEIRRRLSGRALECRMLEED
ncbi:MAG: hypothetical protein IJC29_04250 [Clostridia bacterium]|nr:hypothetical protein [Clostridia bacterium]